MLIKLHGLIANYMNIYLIFTHFSILFQPDRTKCQLVCLIINFLCKR